ncbi:hypothetical protein EIP91_009486 [Steccherinum ochraceum]|uniref:Survival protein SurE-like phosphatase/nucleotidase domain-containing protein n=1 Tax=Steccherinum ochraceum TaxID=92696 RepID=A0A4V2MV27_9APHY|nr:hypothetical protein EIP91_009486 [Steccherinum ochraceum]
MLSASVSYSQKILLTNDDGWATAQIRDQYASLTAAQYDVVLSAPANDRSGTGSTSIPLALPLLLAPCEFNSCPLGSAGTGSNSSDTRLNYFNSFPVDATRYGIQELAPKYFGGNPDLIVSGPNVGENAGFDVLVSGTVGAACEGESKDIPSVAFSGITNDKVSYTTLESDPNSSATLSAHVYSALTTKFVQTLFKGAAGSRLVPKGTIVNVNYPALDFSEGSLCSRPEDVMWVFARLFKAGLLDHDINTCSNNNKLPDGAAVVESGCYASVVVLNSATKLQAGTDAQNSVLSSLNDLGWTCWSESK